MIGLKRGTVRLTAHSSEWEEEAERTKAKLRQILGDTITGIEHIGSTSILNIKAKPIIDIVLAVNDFEDILKFNDKLEQNGFFYRPKSDIDDQILFACGSYYTGLGDEQTHFIHVVLTESEQWQNYINFRDYLNAKPEVARKYEKLKVALSEKFFEDAGREKYRQGKNALITQILKEAREWKKAESQK